MDNFNQLVKPIYSDFVQETFGIVVDSLGKPSMCPDLIVSVQGALVGLREKASVVTRLEYQSRQGAYVLAQPERAKK